LKEEGNFLILPRGTSRKKEKPPFSTSVFGIAAKEKTFWSAKPKTRSIEEYADHPRRITGKSLGGKVINREGKRRW